MGNQTSVPEKIFRAARSNDLATLKELLGEGRAQGPGVVEQYIRDKTLEYTDPEGRTPLIIASSKNHAYVVRLLLQNGANVHHVSGSTTGGSALHSAVRHKAFDCIQILLEHGANPYVENSQGFTAYDIALEQKFVDVVRLFEKHAKYWGWLLLKVPKMFGFVTEWKLKWVVIMHRYPFPNQPSSRLVVRTQCCMYNDQHSYDPKVRLWLDGARVELPPVLTRPNSVAMLVLHTNHRKPANCYVTGDDVQGFRLHLRMCSTAQESIQYLQDFARVTNQLYFEAQNRNDGQPAAAGGGGEPQQPATPPATAAPPITPVPLVPATPNLPPPGPSQSRPGSAAADGGYPHPRQGESDAEYARRLQMYFDAQAGYAPSDKAEQYQPPQPTYPAIQPPAENAPLYPPIMGFEADLHAALPHTAVPPTLAPESEADASTSSQNPTAPMVQDSHPELWAGQLGPPPTVAVPPEPSAPAAGGGAAAAHGSAWDDEVMFICPITQEVMEDPVIAEDGYSYERMAITQWFASGRNTSPITAQRIGRNLIPNYALKSIIGNWKERQPRAVAVKA